MPLIPVTMLPGISKVNSDYAAGLPMGYANGRIARGRFVDGNHVRFVAGFPEKIGGWTAATQALTVGVPRAIRSWRAITSLPLVGIGTSVKLYKFDGQNLTDITPLRTLLTGNLPNNSLTATLGSNFIHVADGTNQLANGDWVMISASTQVGGLTVNGWYQVSSQSGSGYNITLPIAATSSDAGNGGIIIYAYPRKNLTNPFSTVLGSTTVTVVDTGHGANNGDRVTFLGSSPVGGLSLDGEYTLTYLDANTYTIQAATAASSTNTGGGTVSVTYDISLQQQIFSSGIGYGVIPYGTGVYGLDPSVVQLFANGWTLAPYGGLLLAAPIGGTIYVYDPEAGGRAYPLLNAPTDIIGMFVTPERFVVALGTANSTLQMAWADQNDFTDWTSTPTNTANSGRSLQGGSLLVGGLPVTNGVSLVFTDRAVFTMSYTGDNNVYSTLMSGDGSGLLGPYAAVAHGATAYWMSDRDFWMWNGSAQRLPSDDIRDFVYTNINKLYFSKSFAGMNRAKNEVWFFYCSAASTEIDSYVIYHIDQGCWSIGTMQRTAWTDADYFPLPMTGDATGMIYYQEVGTDANGQILDSYIEFAPADVSNGSTNVDVFGFLPDFERLSQPINLTINTRYYPQDANQVSGPFSITANDTTPRVDLRADGKMVGFMLESAAIGGDWRIGVPRVDVQPSGARR